MGLYRDNGKENGNYGDYTENGKENGNYRDSSGYIGIMEKNMETTGIIVVIYMDNGKNGNYYSWLNNL